MKCPSCGYDNKEGAQYCNMCLYSFIKPQPEPARSRQLQAQTASRENREDPAIEKANRQS